VYVYVCVRAYVWGRRLDRGNYVGPFRLIVLVVAAVVSWRGGTAERFDTLW
jgi:hypothetical protein